MADNSNGVAALRVDRYGGCNPFQIDGSWGGATRAARAEQPWAMGRNPVGLHQANSINLKSSEMILALCLEQLVEELRQECALCSLILGGTGD